MLTDDDLTRELGAAFRAQTNDLTYSGRRRPRRTAVVLVPVAAVAIALATVGITATLNAHDHPGTAPQAAPSATTPVHPKLVTEKLSLAGFTLTYERASDQTAPVYATMEPGPVPDGFKPVDNPQNTEAKAWIGKDPGSGESMLYVQVPTRNGGRLFALHSSQWTQDELVDLYLNGTPKTVPMVTTP